MIFLLFLVDVLFFWALLWVWPVQFQLLFFIQWGYWYRAAHFLIFSIFIQAILLAIWDVRSFFCSHFWEESICSTFFLNFWWVEHSLRVELGHHWLNLRFLFWFYWFVRCYLRSWLWVLQLHLLIFTVNFFIIHWVIVWLFLL